MTRRRLVAAGIVLVAVGALVVAGAFSTTGTGRSPAPPLPSQVLTGPPVTVASLKGKPAVVNFWASWCTPCRQEVPQLERFWQSERGHVGLVGVDWNDGADSARSFIAQNHLRYPILRDPTGETGSAYGLSGLPNTFVLDSSGHIVATLRGPQTVASLNAAVAPYE